MQITNAEYKDGELRLKVSARDALRWLHRFETGEYEIVKAKKKRSKDANAYAWVLIGKIADVLNLDKYEIYREAIRKCNQYEPLVMSRERAKNFERLWAKNGTGWQTEIVSAVNDEYVQINAYYGSSVYDTKAMSVLIDNLVQDCKALGIETMPPDELEALLGAWK